MGTEEENPTMRLQNAFDSATEQQSSPLRELTNEQRIWLRQIERDYPDLPAGFALAAIQLYAQDPSLLSKTNIDAWAKTKPPPREGVTQGSIRVLSPEEVLEFEAKVREYEKKRGEISDSNTE